MFLFPLYIFLFISHRCLNTPGNLFREMVFAYLVYCNTPVFAENEQALLLLLVRIKRARSNNATWKRRPAHDVMVSGSPSGKRAGPRRETPQSVRRDRLGVAACRTGRETLRDTLVAMLTPARRHYVDPLGVTYGEKEASTSRCCWLKAR